MATEPTLRHLFPKDDGAPNTLDAAAIIRRSRARRLPKRLAIGGVSTLAVAGIVVATLQGTTVTTPMAASEQSTSSAESAQDLARPATGDAGSASPSESARGSGSGTVFSSPGGGSAVPDATGSSMGLLNRCAAPLADLSTNTEGLVVSLDFPRSIAMDGTPIAGTVTLTNSGDGPLEGYSDENAVVVLSKNGIVQWYSNGLVSSLPAYLTLPTFTSGESRDYPTFFWPVSCGPDQELTTGKEAYVPFGAHLPQVDPGEYEISAQVTFHTDSTTYLVSSPLTTITLK